MSDPAGAAGRWAQVLGLAVSGDGNPAVIELASSGQDLRFLPAASGRGAGITEVRLAAAGQAAPVTIAGVRFVTVPAPGGG